MHPLLLAAWMCLPLAPFNPLEQDTLASINLHIAAGVSSPNGVISVGPEMSVRYEMLAGHPFLIRAGADYRYGQLSSKLYPQGDLHTTTFSLEALYYRGTEQLTGYIGAGGVYATHWFSPTRAVADSLWATENITDVDLAEQFGYRITMGLRYRESYSVELSITELRPDLVKWGRPDSDRISKQNEEIRTGGFRLTFGYLFSLKRY